MIDFSALAAGATVAADTDFPSAAATRRRAADPAFVQLITDASKDHKRRELPGRFSTKPFEGRKGANELSTVANELHRAARQVGTKIAVRRFDVEDATARLTFRVSK